MKEALELGERQSDRRDCEVAEQLIELQSNYSRGLYETGDAAAADAVYEEWAKREELRAFARRPFTQSIAAARGAARASDAWRLRAKRETGQRGAQPRAADRADNVAAGMFGLQMFALERERGRLKELEPLVRLFVRQSSAAETWRPGLAVIYSELGRTEEARAEFEKLAAHKFEDVPRDALWMGSMTFLTDVCVYLGDQSRAAILYRLLEPFAGRNVVIGYEVVCYGALTRYLGSARFNA